MPADSLFTIRPYETFELFMDHADEEMAVCFVETPPLPSGMDYETAQGGPPRSTAVVGAYWDRELERWCWYALSTEAKQVFGITFEHHSLDVGRWYYVKLWTASKEKDDQRSEPAGGEGE